MPAKTSLSKPQLARLGDIVAEPCWHGMASIDQVKDAISDGVFRLYDFYQLDRILKRMPRDVGFSANAADIAEYCTDLPTYYLRNARRVVWLLMPELPFEREICKAIATRKPPAKKYKPRDRIFSVAPDALPQDWHRALADMDAGKLGVNGRVPAPSLITSTRIKLTELVKATLDAKLEEKLTVEATIAYEKSLLNRKRKLSKVTLHSSIRQVRDFARYIGADRDVIEHLESRTRLHENRAAQSLPQKVAKVLALPSYEEIFGRAFDLLGEAAQTCNPRDAQSRRNMAVALTLFCPFPLRVADTMMRFGEEILLNEHGYQLNLVISKSGRRFRAPVLEEFAYFIDQLILQGLGDEYLADKREECFAEKRLLFVKHDGTAPDPRYVSALWHEALGTGCHAARTKLHDEFASLGARGVELAMRACDHRSERTAEFYRTQAFQKLSIERIHADTRSRIFDAEWKEYFEV
ncbi:hypothetical protein AB4874_10920 [Thioclava sp. 15-R06ZXC-3]|uniref:Tyr recombinase domain-containing protein n=1 Tax=Thioclava arctica TaxID=3238301 RepID=A0ABV3TLL8_9RHOB